VKRSILILIISSLIAIICFTFSPPAVHGAGTQDVLKARPLTEVVSQSKRNIQSGTLNVPLITWGGDVATVYTLDSGLFSAEGLNVSLFVENNFPKQVEGCLSGKTPYLRGTMGMINAAAEVFKREGLELVVIYQLTWSTGGDALVTRKSVAQPKYLKNKTIALQLYGPHMDYAANILSSAGVPLTSINFKWFKELTFPSYNTGGKTVDPVSAFLEDDGIDGVMCIIPDALSLTSGGKKGTGAAGSVKDAKIVLSTKTASRIISDVYAVRSDYFKSNKSNVESFVEALLKGQEAFTRMGSQKNSKEFKQLMSHSAKLLFDSAQAVPDVEALLGDCEFVGYNGNIQFFSGRGTTRSMDQLTREIQDSFIKMNLMRNKMSVSHAGWNFDNLKKGLSGITTTTQPDRKKFDIKKIEKKISVESTSWAEEGTLFQVEINFAPNQSVFSSGQYASDFKKALEISQTYGGALIIIEGHSDPLGILQARQKGVPAVELSQMEQQAKNLSLSRAGSVRSSFLAYCKQQQLNLDESQFVAVGVGIKSPKYNPPRTKQEWAANRRVVFRIKQVEAELTEFSPLK